MLIEGHIKLLNLALKHNVEAQKLFLSDKENVNVKYDRLVSGLKYPDLPCASRTMKTDKTGPLGSYDMHVQMNDYQTCNPVVLIKYLASHVGFQKDVLSEAYLSHNYILAYLHSMSPNPSLTNGQVLSNILQFCRVLASLSIRDIVHKDPKRKGLPNAFWIGMMLHTVMDSFSPAHVFRFNHYNEKKSSAMLSSIKTLDSMAMHSGYQATDLSVDVTINVLGAIASDALDGKVHIKTDQDIITEVKKRLLALHLPAEIMTSNVIKQQQAIEVFKAIYMYAMLTREIRNTENLKIPIASSTSPREGIVSFMYYNNQNHLSHFKKDTLMFIKKRYGRKYLDDVVKICSDILTLYANACEKLSKGDATNKKEIQDKFVVEVMSMMRTRVLFMHDEETAAVKSGFDLPNVKQEILRDAKLV